MSWLLSSGECSHHFVTARVVTPCCCVGEEISCTQPQLNFKYRRVFLIVARYVMCLYEYMSWLECQCLKHTGIRPVVLDWMGQARSGVLT